MTTKPIPLVEVKRVTAVVLRTLYLTEVISGDQYVKAASNMAAAIRVVEVDGQVAPWDQAPLLPAPGTLTLAAVMSAAFLSEYEIERLIVAATDNRLHGSVGVRGDVLADSVVLAMRKKIEAHANA